MTDQVFNEPIATGWLRTELRGDIDTAKGYVMDARKLLGGMRIAFGVNQRIADGEAGGFYQLSRQLPDGSVMQAITNNGQDTIRITTRSAQQQSSADAPLTGTASKSTVQGESHSFVATHEDGPIPVPVLTRKTEEEGEEKREEEDPKPYMWVGARIRYDLLQDVENGVPPDSLIMYVVEPQQQEPLPGQESGIVTSASIGWQQSIPMLGNLIRPSGTHPATLDINAQAAEWPVDFPWVPTGRWQYQTEDRQSGDVGNMRFTAHLLRHYDWTTAADVVDPTINDPWFQVPFDPLATQADTDARVLPSGRNPRTLWDQVVVLDPYEGQDEPTSHRPGDAAALQVLGSMLNVVGEDMVLGGEYQIFIGAMGLDCHASLVPYPNNYGWNEDLTYYPEPLPVEVEVRVGKYPDLITQQFQMVIPRYSQVMANYWPFGDGSLQGGCPLNGQNAHSPNWWPGVITADPIAISIGSAEEYVPADLFGGDGVGPLCDRIPWDIYVQIFQPYCAYADGSYQDEAANQVWYLLTRARMGIYGQVSIPRRTLAQVIDAAALVIAPTGSEGLYHYDAETNIFTAVATPAEDPALTYDTGSFRTWEYTYRWQSFRACRTFGKVRLGQGDPVFSGFLVTGDPYDVMHMNCCRVPGHPLD